jgi:hypothetical protein
MTHSAHVKSLSCWALYGTESTGRNKKGQVDTHAGSRKSDEALAAAAAPVFSHPARKGRRLIGPEGVGLCCCFALARNLITDDERIPEQRRDVVRRRLAAKNVAVTVGASHGVVKWWGASYGVVRCSIGVGRVGIGWMWMMAS